MAKFIFRERGVQSTLQIWGSPAIVNAVQRWGQMGKNGQNVQRTLLSAPPISLFRLPP